MKKVTIGLLLPSSTVTPMSKDFETGFKKTISSISDEWDVEVFPEFIAQGSIKRVEEALDKFFHYHQVDIVSGIISNRVAMMISDKFEKHKRPIVINNIGEHIPDARKFNSYTFINSTHTWQQVWSLANWAVTKFGKKGMFVSGMYDAGYSFMKMMSDGMKAANPEFEIPYSVAPLDDTNVYSQVDRVFDHIELFKPDFVFAFFCGTEATQFLNGYISRGYHKTLPLLSLPFLLEEFDPTETPITIYTALNSKVELELGISYTEKVSLFNQLGQETGSIVMEGLKKTDANSLVESFKDAINKSHINISNVGRDANIYLIENKYNGDKTNITRHIIQQLPTIHVDSPQYLQAIDEFSSSWENPYLGI